MALKVFHQHIFRVELDLFVLNNHYEDCIRVVVGVGVGVVGGVVGVVVGVVGGGGAAAVVVAIVDVIDVVVVHNFVVNQPVNQPPNGHVSDLLTLFHRLPQFHHLLWIAF